MLYLVVFIGFVLAAVITSGIAHTPRAWRYAMGLTMALAVPLIIWSVEWLQVIAKFLGVRIELTKGLPVVALPFGIVMARLAMRRRHTPRYVPSAEDDPVYRRFLEEKRRRRRLRRQQEDALDYADERLGL